MNVSLPTPLEEFVRHKVAAGEFQSTDEVVCEGLRLLQGQESWKADARAKINAGWEQAKHGQLRSPEEVTRNLSSRKRAWQRGRPG
jgi:putative addiction module CopG family antidote